jgi:hypothetical protein
MDFRRKGWRWPILGKVWEKCFSSSKKARNGLNKVKFAKLKGSLMLRCRPFLKVG